MPTTDRKLHVFLCHASQDKPIVRELYQRLLAVDWIDPWLDEEKLLPGQDWDMEIEKAVEAADVVIVCLSNTSVSKEGYIQRELKFALDIALEKPEGTIFIVPLRLDDCDLPRRLRSWHYVDYFPARRREQAYQRLLKSLDVRYGQLQSKVDDSNKATSAIAVATANIAEEKRPTANEIFGRIAGSLRSKGSGGVDVGGSILQILFFALAALNVLAPSDTLTDILMGMSAILTGIVLLIRKQIPATIIFKISVIVYLLPTGLGYRIEDLIPFAPFLAGIGALISGGILILTIQTPKKQVFYSAISFALFLFLAGAYELVTNIVGYPPIISEVDTLIFITSIVTSILLLRDL
jgi:TIR domain